uniref:PHD finger protein 10 n=1 Tax=Panagrellus redivivus TaxID=6233 RepID=A0A7E4W8M9_PANRE
MSTRNDYELEEGEIVSSDDSLETDPIEETHTVVADPVQQSEPIVEERAESIPSASAQQSEIVSEAPAERPDTVVVDYAEQPEATIANTVVPIEVDPLNQSSSSVVNLKEESSSSLGSPEEHRMEVDVEQSQPETEHAEMEIGSIAPNDVVLSSDHIKTTVEPTTRKRSHSTSPTPTSETTVQPTSQKRDHSRSPTSTSNIIVAAPSSQPKCRREQQSPSIDSESSEDSTDDDPEYVSESSSEEHGVADAAPSEAAELLYVEHNNVTVNYADECVEDDEEYVEDEEQWAEDGEEYAEDGQEYSEDEEIDAEDGEQISEDEDIEQYSEADGEHVPEIELDNYAELDNEQYEDSDDVDYVEDDDDQYVEDDDDEYFEDEDEHYALDDERNEEDDNVQYSNEVVEHEADSVEAGTVGTAEEGDEVMMEQDTDEQPASGNVDQYVETHSEQPAEGEDELYMEYYEEMETDQPATSDIPQYFEERYSDYEESVADEPTTSATPDIREDQHKGDTPIESVHIRETEEAVKEPAKGETDQPSEIINLADTKTPEAEQRTGRTADDDVIFEGVTPGRASVEVVDSSEQHQSHVAETLPPEDPSQSVIDLTGDRDKEGAGTTATEKSDKETPLIDKIRSYTWSRTDPRADIFIVSGSSSDELQNDTLKNNYVDRVITSGPNADIIEISGEDTPPRGDIAIENEEMEVDDEESVPQPGTAEEPIEIDDEPRQIIPSCYRPSRDDSSDQADVEDNDAPLQRDQDSASLVVLPLHSRRRRKALARYARVVKSDGLTELESSESDSGDSVKCLKASIKNHRCEQDNCMAAGSNLYVKYHGAYHHGLQATEFTDCLGNTYDLIVQDPEAGQMTTIDIKEYKEVGGRLEYLTPESSSSSSSIEEPGTDDEYVIKQIANKLNGNIDQYDVEYEPDYLSTEEFDAVEQATAEMYEDLNLLDNELVAPAGRDDEDEKDKEDYIVNSDDESNNSAEDVIVISDDEPETEVTPLSLQQEQTAPLIVEIFDDATEADRLGSSISQANTAVTVVAESDDNGSYMSSGSGRFSSARGCSPVAFDPSWFDFSGDNVDGSMEGPSGVYYDPYDYYDPFVWDDDAVPPTERFESMTGELEEVRIIPISINGENVQMEVNERRTNKVIRQIMAEARSTIDRATAVVEAVPTITLEVNNAESQEGADNQSNMEVDDHNVDSTLSQVVDETISLTDAGTKSAQPITLDQEEAISPAVEEPMSASDGEAATAEEIPTITIGPDDADSKNSDNIQSPMEVDLTSDNDGEPNEDTLCNGEDHEDMQESSADDDDVSAECNEENASVTAKPSSTVDQSEYDSEEELDEQDEDAADEDAADEDELSTSDPSDCDYPEPTSKIEHPDYDFDEMQYEYDPNYTEIDPALIPRFCDPFVHNYVPREKPAYMHKTNINRPILASEQLCDELAKGKSANYGLIDPIEKELANAMRMNYQMQISLIEEISRLVCNGRAEYEELGPIPNLEPSECIHPDSPVKPLSYATELCSEKEPLKMYVHEVWWAWIESHLPEFTSDDVDQLRDELEKMTVGCVREDSDESVVDEEETDHSDAGDAEEIDNSDAETAEETCIPDSDDEITYELDLSEISQYLKDGKYTIQLITQDDGEGGTQLTAEIVENEDDEDEEDYQECDEEVDQVDDDEDGDGYYGIYDEHDKEASESCGDEEESVEEESEEDAAFQAAEDEDAASLEVQEMVSSPDSDPAYSDPDGALYFAEKLNVTQPDNKERMEDDIPREQSPREEPESQKLRMEADIEKIVATPLKEISPTAEITVCQNVETTPSAVSEKTHGTEAAPHLPAISIVGSSTADPQEMQQSSDDVVDDVNDNVIEGTSNESVSSDESESTLDEQVLSIEEQEQWRVLENLVELQIIENNELAGGTDEEDSDYEDSDEVSSESDNAAEEDISMDEVVAIRKEVIDDFGEFLLEDSVERKPTPETSTEELTDEEVSIAEAVSEEASAANTPVRDTSEVPVSEKASSEEIVTANPPATVVIETPEPEVSIEDNAAEGPAEYMSVSEGESVHSENGSQAEDFDVESQYDEEEEYYEDDDADFDSEADDAEDEYDQSSVEDESDYEDEEYEDEEDEDAIFYEAESNACSECSESDSEKKEGSESPDLSPVAVTVINDFLPEENSLAEDADDIPVIERQRKRQVSSSAEPPPLKSIDPFMLYYRERRKRHAANMTVNRQQRTKRYRRQEILTPSRIRPYQWSRGDSSDESTVSTPPWSLRQNAHLPTTVKRPKTAKMRMRKVKKLRPYLYHSFDPKDFQYNEKGERLRRKAENLRRRKWNLAPLPDFKPRTKKPVVNHPIPLLKTLPKNRNTRLRSLQTAYVSGDDSLDDDKETQFDLKSEDDLSEYWKSDDEEKFETGPNFLTKLRAMKREVVSKQWTVSVDRFQIHPRPRRAPIPVEIRNGEVINVSKKFAEMVISDSEEGEADISSSSSDSSAEAVDDITVLASEPPLSTSPSPQVGDDDERMSPASDSSEPCLGYGIEKIRPTAKSPPPSNSEYILASIQERTPTPSDRSTSASSSASVDLAIATVTSEQPKLTSPLLLMKEGGEKVPTASQLSEPKSTISDIVDIQQRTPTSEKAKSNSTLDVDMIRTIQTGETTAATSEQSITRLVRPTEKSPPPSGYPASDSVQEKTPTPDRSKSNSPISPKDFDDERMSVSSEVSEPESPLSQTEDQEEAAAQSNSNSPSELDVDMERMSRTPENDEPMSTTSLTQVIRATAKSPPPSEKDIASISSVLIRPTVTSPPPSSGKPAYVAFVRPHSAMERTSPTENAEPLSLSTERIRSTTKSPPPELTESSESDDEADDEYETDDNENTGRNERIVEFVEEVGFHENEDVPEHLEKYCTPLNPTDGSSTHDTWKDILKQPPPPDLSFSFMGLELEPETINNLLSAGVLAIDPETNKVYDTTENETILNIKGPAEPAEPEVSDEEESVDEEEAEIDRELAEVQAQLEAAALQLKTQNNTILRLMKDQAKRQELSEMLKKTEATLFDNADADPDEGDPFDMAFAYDDLYSYYKDQNYGELIQKRAQRHEDAKAFEQFKGFPTGY